MTSTTTHKGSLDQSLRPSLRLVYSQAMTPFLPVGNSSCQHSAWLFVSWDTVFCGLCFLKVGFNQELPSRLHLSKTLADNGNPQQTGKLESHVSVVEGIFAPGTMTLKQFSRARGHLGSAPAPNIFPFSSALWTVIGRQPPLGWPLYLAVRGFSEEEIAKEMGVSIYNVNERLSKGVDMAAKLVRKYDERKWAGSQDRHDTSDQTQDGAGSAKPSRSRSKRR